MSEKRLLLLSVSAGAGHVRAAEAIRAAAAERADTISVSHLDVMHYVTAGFRKMYTDFYIGLVNKHPTIWGHLNQIIKEAQAGSRVQRLRRAIAHLNTGALLREIEAFAPDVIICTHFLPAEILANAAHKKNGARCPVWIQATDFDLHRMWVQDHVAGYFAANEEVAFRMGAYGIASDKIHVTGIPVMPAFGHPPARGECAIELGLTPGRTTFLLMGGGDGLGNLDILAERVMALAGDFQLVALAGKNARAFGALRALAERHAGRMWAHAYSDRVERLMACADVVITKPGGLTTSECLAMGLPMIVNSPIPGQEERNADYLMEQGVALKALDEVTLAYRIHYLLAHPGVLSAMGRRARALGRPDAARAVLSAVLT